MLHQHVHHVPPIKFGPEAAKLSDSTLDHGHQWTSSTFFAAPRSGVLSAESFKQIATDELAAGSEDGGYSYIGVWSQAFDLRYNG